MTSLYLYLLAGAPIEVPAFFHIIHTLLVLAGLPRPAAWIALNTPTVTRLLIGAARAVETKTLPPGAATALAEIDAVAKEHPRIANANVLLRGWLTKLGFLAVIGVVSSALLVTGCAAFWADLPAVNTGVQTATLVIGQIESWVAAYFQAHPNPAIQTKILMAIDLTRKSLVALSQAASTAKDVHDGGLIAAEADFRGVYQALLDLVASIGVQAQGKASASPDGGPVLVVPPPDAIAFPR